MRDLQKDLIRDTFSSLAKRAREMDGLASTVRAIEEAQRARDLTVKMLAGNDLFDRRKLAATALDLGILRTAETISRNQNAIAAAIAGAHAHDEIANLASSIVSRMDALRFGDFGRDAFPKSIADEFAEQFATARDAAERFEAAETEEERAALLAKLLAAVLTVLRGIAGNTKKEVLGMGLVLMFSITANIYSFIPHEAPPGMTPAQVQKLDETHSDTEALHAEFKEYREHDKRMNELYVSNLPQAELVRKAMIRVEPARHGKALWHAPAGTPLAVAKVQGRWRLVTYREPLTDELAQGWIYGDAVRLLDDE